MRKNFPDRKNEFTNLFPTQLYKEERISNYDAIQEEMLEYVNKIEWQWSEGWDSHWLSSLDFKKNPVTELPLISEQLGYALEDYCAKMHFYENTGATLKSSWFSCFQKNNYAHIHSHRAADIAGVYYFSTDGDDGDLFFTSPIANAKASKSWAQEKINYPPQQGSLLLFPGWLEHGVGTNLKDHARISLSFNVEVVELNELPSSNYRRFTNAQR